MKDGEMVEALEMAHRIWQKHNPPRFTWTDKAPTQEGWFWLLRGESAKVVPITRQRAFGGRLGVYVRPEGLVPLVEIQNALWAGPIPHPHEP